MQIIQATNTHLNMLASLFNGYRIFYKQESNLNAAKNFLSERVTKEDSIILIALSENNEPMGFTQLYPIFSSVSMQRTYILNDLFVDANFRKKGIGEALLKKAKTVAIANNSKGITLETETTNSAQKLYERLDWKKDTEVYHYTWETPPNI